MPVSFKTEFSAQCVLRMQENTVRIEKCLEDLDETEVWQRANDQLSSIANLILHLCGNIRQYAISSLGDVADSRERQKEFKATGGYTKQQLMALLSATVAEACMTISAAGAEELQRVRSVQGFKMTGIAICIHVTEHLSYHTGQIALHTKLARNKDLGFYAGIDLDIQNETSC